jgi:PAS domain S-box-containing protein
MFDYSKGHEPLAVMVARIDPNDHLYPMLNNWPVPRKTAESFLVKKDADKIVLLSNCREDKRSALNYTVESVKHPEMPAVMAANGISGIVKGKNISGTKVIAFVDKVPGTDWFLVSKMDYEEAMAPANTAFKAIIILSILVIAVAGLFFLFINRSQKYKHYKEIAKKSEELAESEENLRITLESIGDGVITTDTQGRITRMNRTSEKLTGWNLSEAAGKEITSVFRIINAYSRKEVMNPVEIVINDGRTVGLANHTVLIAKNGKEFQIADSAAPITDETVKIHGMILVFSDVTEKYEVQEKIAENERFLSSLISNLKGMVYRCVNNERWSLVYSTVGSKDITGYLPEELIGGKIRYADLVFPDDVPVLENAINSAVMSGQHFKIEYRITDRNDCQKWVLEKGKGIYDDKGELKFIEGFITDITVSKTAEIQIREKSEELERSNRLMVDREIRMIELKKEVNELLKECGRSEKYGTVE